MLLLLSQAPGLCLPLLNSAPLLQSDEPPGGHCPPFSLYPSEHGLKREGVVCVCLFQGVIGNCRGKSGTKIKPNRAFNLYASIPARLSITLSKKCVCHLIPPWYYDLVKNVSLPGEGNWWFVDERKKEDTEMRREKMKKTNPDNLGGSSSSIWKLSKIIARKKRKNHRCY